jgi:RimJ/RimL family protein N-acetyltransferase
LRVPTDADLMALADIAAEGIHDRAEMPFQFAWTDVPSPELERSVLRYMWGARATWSPDAWKLPLVVLEDGRVVGVQELGAERFPVRRVVETGSWLGRADQGRGIGTRMRAAALHLAFEGLDAVMATSGVLAGNEASRRVSEKLGYRPNGVGIVAPRGVPVEERRYLLRREDWRPERRATIEGLEACLDMFGLA